MATERKTEQNNDNVGFYEVGKVIVRGSLYNPDTKEKIEVVVDPTILGLLKNSKFGSNKIANNFELEKLKYTTKAWSKEEGKLIDVPLYAMKKPDDVKYWDFPKDKDNEQKYPNFSVRSLKLVAKTPNGKEIETTFSIHRNSETAELTKAAKEVLNRVAEGLFKPDKVLKVALEFNEEEGKKRIALKKIYVKDKVPEKEQKEQSKEQEQIKNKEPKTVSTPDIG